MIKVISIDFWNTIVDTRNGEKRRELRLNRFLEICKKYRPELNSNQIELAISDSVKWFETIWENEHRTVLSAEIIRYILEKLQLKLSDDEFLRTEQIFQCGILEAEPDLAPNVEKTIEILSEKYRLAIISDTHFSPGNILRQLLEKKGLLKFFSAFSFSDEVGQSKPHPKMYRNIAETAKVTLAEMVHIGDMNRTDIIGAKNLGIASILYTGVNKLDSGTGFADFETSEWTKIPETIRILNEKLR